MRSLVLVTLLSSLSSLSSTALATPTLQTRNGQTIRVRVGRERERGIGLRPIRASEWRLELSPSDADSAEVVDVTGGAAGTRWQVAVADNALRFDTARFCPDHAYRVQLRRGSRMLGSALVYLYPPKIAASHELRFDDDTSGRDDDELATLPKPSL